MLKTRLFHHRQAALGSFRTICSKPFAAFMTTLVLAITLTLPALFWFFTHHLDLMANHWQDSGRISLYLKPSLPMKEQMTFLLHVKSINGVGNAALKTPEEGLLLLQAQEGMTDIMTYLPENPLPAVVEVTPTLQFKTPEKLQQLHRQLKALPEVEQAKLDMQWVNRLHAVLDFIHDAVTIVSLILGLAVILIIGNTLRLAIHNQREEIQVLKLIGATDAYIARPFLYSGIWYGMTGAMMALILVNGIIWMLQAAASSMAAAYQIELSFMNFTFSQCLLLLCSAIILGWLAARASVKKQLASIEPYL